MISKEELNKQFVQQVKPINVFTSSSPLADVLSTKVHESSFSDMLFGSRAKWDIRQLNDIAKSRHWDNILPILQDALNTINREQDPNNVEELCRSLLPLLDNEDWQVSHAPTKPATTIMVKVGKLVARVLRRYLDEVSQELRDEIEPKLVFHDL